MLKWSMHIIYNMYINLSVFVTAMFIIRCVNHALFANNKCIEILINVHYKLTFLLKDDSDLAVGICSFEALITYLTNAIDTINKWILTSFVLI